MEQARGKMVKRIDESFWGQKGRLCFAADCSFFLLPRNNFPFSRFRNVDLNVLRLGLNLCESSPPRIDLIFLVRRITKLTSVLLLNQNVFSLPFAIFVSQESRRRFSNSPHFIEIREAVNFNIGKKIIEIGI